MSTDRTRLTTALAGRYRLEREPGRGGMATVYLAHDLRHDRSGALKVLHSELSTSVEADYLVAQDPNRLVAHPQGGPSSMGTEGS